MSLSKSYDWFLIYKDETKTENDATNHLLAGRQTLKSFKVTTRSQEYILKCQLVYKLW